MTSRWLIIFVVLIAISHFLTQSTGQQIDCSTNIGPDDLTISTCLDQYVMLKGNQLYLTGVKLRGTGNRLPVTGAQADVLPAMNTFTAIAQNNSATYLFRTNADGSLAICTIAQNEENNCQITTSAPDCSAINFPAVTGLGGNHRVEAATWTPSGFFFLVTNVATSTVFQLVTDLAGNQLVRRDVLPNTRPPSAVTHIRTVGATSELLVFFDDVVGVHQVALASMTAPITVNNRIDYQQSKVWIGCSPEFCFDGNIDAASASPEGGIVLFRGRYQARLPRIGDALMAPTELPAAMAHADAAFLYNGQIVVTKGPNYVQTGNINFPALSAPVDAAAVARVRQGLLTISILALAQNSTITGYSAILNVFTQLRTFQVPTGLPLPLDAVATLAVGQGSELIFIKENFFARTPIVFPPPPTPPPLPPLLLIQGNLFQCLDNYYQQSAIAQRLGLLNYEAFAMYRDQFRLDRVPTTAPTTPPTVAPNDTTTALSSPAKSSSTIIIIGVIFALLLVAGLAFCLMKSEISRSIRAPKESSQPISLSRPTASEAGPGENDSRVRVASSSMSLTSADH